MFCDVTNFGCRPDLVDFRQVQRQTARTNLDMAFKLFESEYNVTPLLDAEGGPTLPWKHKILLVLLIYYQWFVTCCVCSWICGVETKLYAFVRLMILYLDLINC